jgi:hypothetical protein
LSIENIIFHLDTVKVLNFLFLVIIKSKRYMHSMKKYFLQSLYIITFTITTLYSEFISINSSGENLNIPKYTNYTNLYPTIKNGDWSLAVPDNKFGAILKYNSSKNAYRITTIISDLETHDGYLSAIASPHFTLDSNTSYQIVIKMQAKYFPKGQHIMVSLIGPNNEKFESLWSVSTASTWEEVYLTIDTSTIDGQRGEWYLKFFSSVGFRSYQDSSIGWISKDIKIFKLPKGKELVSTQGIQLLADKIPFESSTRKVDALGNFYRKENGTWKHVFPKMIYRDSHQTHDYTTLFKGYLEYGFNGIMDISTKTQLEIASEIGMTNLSLFLEVYKVNGDFSAVLLDDMYNSAKRYGLESKILWYNFDNENENTRNKAYQNWASIYINAFHKDVTTGKRQFPIYYLNGAYGLARDYLNNDRQDMDITGTYIGQDVAEEGKNGKRDLRSGLLTQLLTPNQKAPASVMQIQKHFGKKFIPTLFYGISQGGRALSVWKDGYYRSKGDTRRGDRLTLQNAYWAPAFRDYISTQLDALLPLIKQVQFTSWAASTNASPEVRMGTRELKGVRYLILSNFSNTDKEVTVDLDGYNATEALDYFTQRKIADISNGKFTFTLGKFNQGYQVIKLKL